MKLRFHSNTLRLRLSQVEVAKLAESGRVEEKVAFAPGQTFSYSVESSPAEEVAAAFDGGHIRVTLPRALAAHWIESDETGIEALGATLRILVEKDFQCMHRDSPEDAGAFPNPLARDK